MQCKTILIIEDEKPIRDMMQDVLEIEGYEILSASNGQEGIEKLKKSESNPCVILLDLMMPVMTGWDFLDFLRTDSRYSKIPVVVCSAFHETAKSIRPSAIVSKPVQLPSLLKAVHAFCAA